MGFLSVIPGRAWEALAVLLALAAFGGYMYYRGGVHPRAELATIKAEYAAFQAQVKALGEQAQKAAKAKEDADKLAKEKADRENAKTKSDLAGMYAAYRSLRKQSANGASGSILPAAAPGAASPERACLNRSAADSAISDFDSGVTGLLEKGDGAIVNLNTAKAWAQSP